ncbi:hypothetical protein ACNTMW_01990 [Planosporangium sp. 12N6]|uniref:hypothetical protein n=1 Tax=Planosporangium spinosum TaxID=3402278 RepID=UPI003CEC2C02
MSPGEGTAVDNAYESNINPEDARRALDEIAERRRQVKLTAAAPLPWWYLTGGAVGMWLIGASQDLSATPSVMAAGLALFIATNTGLHRVRRVQVRTWTRQACLVAAGGSAVLLAVQIGTIMVAYLAHVPRPHMVAGGAMATAFVVLAVLMQRIARARLRAHRG